MRTRDLKPNPKNPRKTTDVKLEMLKRAMLEFGDLSGIVFNRKSDQLVGGHQRTKILPPDAAVTITKEYKKPTKTGTVAVGYVELNGEQFTYREVSWDKHREMAANIAANKGAGEWDLPELTEWMKELTSFDADDFDISLTMFDEDELEDFGGIIVSEHTRTGATGVDEDEVPEKPISRTRPGYVYELGDHRLMCGNAIDALQVNQLLNGEKPVMVYTDPPYGMSVVKKKGMLHGVGITGAAKSGVYRPIEGDDSTVTAIEAYKLCAELKAKTLVFWGANFYAEALPPSSGWICWDKENGEGFFADGELAWTNLPKQLRIFKHQWRGMIKASERGEKRVHPTQKPVSVAEWCFANYGDPATVLDLFGGSGSTLIACEKTGRKCFMMELDTGYCDVIIERFEKYTGQKAVLLNPNKMPKVTKLRKHRTEVNADAR